VIIDGWIPELDEQMFKSVHCRPPELDGVTNEE
jgi:hypothetical protein